ncbi:hypothetical protein FACS1894137_09450 [Spirochaetia bacterium]|nr:hypothetical protein FACS1894137_09450 [Spirochaetia bacterium]
MKSEIRDSEINELLEKVSKRNYGKYLLSKCPQKTILVFYNNGVCSWQKR